VQPIGADAPEVTARSATPAGSVIGLYQPPARPSTARRTAPTSPFSLLEVPSTKTADCGRRAGLRHFRRQRKFPCAAASARPRRYSGITDQESPWQNRLSCSIGISFEPMALTNAP
jgi:hypothetical protein